MKSIIVFLVVLVSPVLIQAQFARVDKVESHRIALTGNLNFYHTVDDDYVMVPFFITMSNLIRSKIKYEDNYSNGSLYLYHFDNDLRLNDNKNHNLSRRGGFNFYNSFKFGDDIVAIYEKEARNVSYTLAYTTISGTNLNQSTPIELWTTPMKPNTSNKLSFLVSNDNQHFALINQVESRDGNVEINCAVFDKNYNMLWQNNSIGFKSIFDIGKIESIILGNDKKVYVFIESFSSQKNSENTAALFIIDDKGAEHKTFSFKDAYLAGSRISYKDNKILTTGFVIESSKDGVKGMYSCVFDLESKSFNKINIHEFSSDLLSLAKFKNPARDRGTNKLESLVIRNIINLNNGKSMVLLEESYILITEKDRERTVTYHDGCIIYALINSTGEFEWVKLLPKKQTSRETKAAVNSFIAHHYNDNVYVIFNDAKANENTIHAYETRLSNMAPRGTNIACVRINPEDGSYKKIHLLKKGHPATVFNREYTAVTSEHLVLVGMSGRNNKHLISVRLD